ncbi:MAG: hypothetical protein M3Q07_11000, partial [Pseudobdellovibrionaceae bacterium]|nr:hypothetical protein [Pseudobdellovibrionaceae bacterium]
FTFYWNNRKFPRGKRKGSSPIEILSAQKSDVDWVDLLLEKFPFNKLHHSPAAILQTKCEEKNPAA